MILLGYDIETTGLDKINDRVIEIGLTLYSTGYKKSLDSLGQLVQRDGKTIPPKITEITGITEQMCDRFGYPQENALDTVITFAEQADAIVAFNGRRFDLPLTMNWAKRLSRAFPEKLLIDPFTDLPGAQGQELVTMCVKHGKFMNPFPHEAQADERSTLKLLSENFDLDKVIERAKSPLVVVVSGAPRTKTNSENKEAKFRWNPDNKIWWKAVKEMDVPELANQVPFPIFIADKSISLEELENS